MKRRLLTVQGPLQYIAGYIAYRWNRPPTADVEDVLVLYDFLAAPQVEREIADAVRALSRSASWSRVVFISGEDMKTAMRNRYSRSMARLRSLIGVHHFDEIYLARDHVGDGSPLLLNAYAKARKLSYGDSLGLVGQRESLSKLDPPLSAASRLRGALRRTLLGTPEPVAFDGAVLSLPIDMSGTYLPQVDLDVPSRDHVVACVEQIYAAVPELRAYCRALCDRGEAGRSHLYLLSNLTASNLTSAPQEAALYAEVIRENSTVGGTVYLKPHPRSTFEVLDTLAADLGADYRVVVVDDKRFSRMPVELWVDLIRHCQVVAMFSTSAINLKYLFDKQVIMPLDEARIARFIAPTAIDHISSVCRMMRETLAKLEVWDGRSVLWSGA
jgi:hypothetical protein